ncbi:helix-turn-helix transcriptional regulator [Runella sp. MFBS21]|uniref:helix-turn-helix domain-containing protein n=1 Tax=Runella sp. MFBS21 TaxID=3034018 RepID=UPI0023F89E21|nr:helix-turn-helix transcriptional regulator [Runella sp. MFBS21]MDF7820688.1 helix-turn-helix transcriptional regulator [Runella sp. MFBS21]
MKNTENETLKRSDQLVTHYFFLLDSHLNDLISGKTNDMFELNDIANILCVSQKHLIKIIQKAKGNHPCHFYMEKILEQSKLLLSDTDWSIAEIAHRLTYDPSNFTKFFKKYEGKTPSEYRMEVKKAKSSPL